MKASPEKILELIKVAKEVDVLKDCLVCKGLGGFEDTTYIRSGEWGHCGACNGSGLVYCGPVSPAGQVAKSEYLSMQQKKESYR